MLTLRNYLILMLALVAALPLVLFWAWPHSRAMQNELEQVNDRHLLIARNLGSALQRYHRDLTATFDFTADALLARRPMPPAKSLLENLRFRSICLVAAASGKVVAGVSGSQSCPAMIDAATLAASAASPANGPASLTGVHAGPDGAPVIKLLRSAGDRLVVGTIDTSYFRELGQSIAFGIKGHAAIVDGRGRVLSHPLPTWVKEMKDISKVSAVRRMLAGEQGVETFLSPAIKDDMIAGFTSVPSAGWGVMVPQPLSELRAKAAEVQQSALIVLAIGLLAAAVFARGIAVTLARPIERACAAARRLAAGDCRAIPGEASRLLPAELNALTATFTDMTRRLSSARSAEAAALTAAEAASESKTQFLRTVTHELRSPLNAIIGFADMIASERCGPPGSAQYRKYAKDIGAGSRHLLSLTNDLLDLARIEAGQYDLAEEIFGIDEVAERAARYAEAEAQARGSAIRVEIGEPVPAVKGDERALFQVLLNLTVNAIRYGKQGGHVAITARALPSGEAEIIVADDGPGIAPEDLERVLKPFQRATAPQHRDIRGTGLGLPIVDQLVRLHGGEFALTSVMGRGTQARIVLPATRVLQASDETLRTAA